MSTLMLCPACLLKTFGHRPSTEVGGIGRCDTCGKNGVPRLAIEVNLQPVTDPTTPTVHTPPPSPCLVGRYSLQEDPPVSGPYSEAFVTPYSTWRHKKGGLYVALGIGTSSTNGGRDGVERSVVYVSMKYRKIRYREVSEFLDGRFIPLDGDGCPMSPGDPPPCHRGDSAQDSAALLITDPSPRSVLPPTPHG